MTENQAMDEVLAATEKVSGKPVVLQADASIAVHATIKIGRGNVPVHVLLYQPRLEREREYLVAFQCGFLLRLFAVPANERFDLIPAPAGKSEVERRTREHFKRRKQNLPEPVVQQLCGQFHNGLGTQLRSMPVGLRVDAWIHSSYPVLREQQRAAIVRQLNENAAALQPNVRDISPPKVYTASVGMSAAFAWD